MDSGHGGVVHEPTVTRVAGLPSARSPSFDGVVKTARNSAELKSRIDTTYEPVGEVGLMVATLLQVVVPGARRCNRTVRCETGLPLNRP